MCDAERDSWEELLGEPASIQVKFVQVVVQIYWLKATAVSLIPD
jgi:hypothetical protein